MIPPWPPIRGATHGHGPSYPGHEVLLYRMGSPRSKLGQGGKPPPHPGSQAARRRLPKLRNESRRRGGMRWARSRASRTWPSSTKQARKFAAAEPAAGRLPAGFERHDEPDGRHGLRRRRADGRAHAAGSTKASHAVSGIPGITPAFAGSTRGCHDSSNLSGDHPRVRGEHPPTTTTLPSACGSPPRSRGALCLGLLRAVVPGITPAFAGST